MQAYKFNQDNTMMYLINIFNFVMKLVFRYESQKALFHRP